MDVNFGYKNHAGELKFISLNMNVYDITDQVAMQLPVAVLECIASSSPEFKHNWHCIVLTRDEGKVAKKYINYAATPAEREALKKLRFNDIYKTFRNV